MTAEEKLDELLAQERREAQERERAVAAEREREAECEKARHRLEALAELSEKAVRRLARAGKLTSDDVECWYEITRAAERRRVQIAMLEGDLTAAFGRLVRVLDDRAQYRVLVGPPGSAPPKEGER